MNRKLYKSTGFSLIAYIYLAIYFLIVLLPLMNLISVSLSGEFPVNKGQVGLLPIEFNFNSYLYILSGARIYKALWVSVMITVFGTVIGLFLSGTAAYALSKRNLPGRRGIMVIYIFTMMFNGGLIPTYILILNLGLLNSIWAVILTLTNSVFNLLIMKNYFEALPDEIEESAKVDGASQIRIFVRIVLPLAVPVIATISVFYAVGFWNDYFYGRLYLTSPSLHTAQMFLNAVIYESASPVGGGYFDREALSNVSQRSMINATVVICMLPIILAYPIFYKYLISGIVVGSVKG